MGHDYHWCWNSVKVRVLGLLFSGSSFRVRNSIMARVRIRISGLGIDFYG